MFANMISCPIAVTHTPSDPEDCYDKAVKWAFDRMEEGQSLTVWTVQKNTVYGNSYLEDLLGYRGVRHITERGSFGVTADGPVVAFYPRRDEIAAFNTARGMTALSVVTWTHPLNVWAAEVGAEILVEDDPSREIDWDMPSEYAELIVPEAREELESLTRRINISNTISAGFEKRDAVRALRSMRQRGILPDPKAAVEWTAAHGWERDNPKKFGEMVEKVAAGRNLRA